MSGESVAPATKDSAVAVPRSAFVSTAKGAVAVVPSSYFTRDQRPLALRRLTAMERFLANEPPTPPPSPKEEEPKAEAAAVEDDDDWGDTMGFYGRPKTPKPEEPVAKPPVQKPARKSLKQITEKLHNWKMNKN